MQRDGLVEIDAAKEITLSASGLEAAESIKRRHLLTERLLVDILKLDWADAHEEAHLIDAPQVVVSDVPEIRPNLLQRALQLLKRSTTGRQQLAR